MLVVSEAPGCDLCQLCTFYMSFFSLSFRAIIFFLQTVDQDGNDLSHSENDIRFPLSSTGRLPIAFIGRMVATRISYHNGPPLLTFLISVHQENIFGKD